jgi:glutamyl-tRNA synthetase
VLHSCQAATAEETAQRTAPTSGTGVKVRFAPSPTGNLHVGGARTALFNWLFAKNMGGQMVLRVEDTDAARSTKESEEAVLKDLRWLGITYDEGPDVGGPNGPYRQSERKEIYNKKLQVRHFADENRNSETSAYPQDLGDELQTTTRTVVRKTSRWIGSQCKNGVQELRDKGLVYPCFCTDEELAQMKARSEELKIAPIYRGKWATAKAEEVQAELDKGTPHCFRFRVQPGKTVIVRDLIRGDVTFNTDNLGDFVVMRSNGLPVYNFCVAVDDATMCVTHVLRAEEHLPNTLRQLLLYEAMGYTPPKFGHMSLILAPDKSKLSKRHGATSVGEFREQVSCACATES